MAARSFVPVRRAALGRALFTPALAALGLLAACAEGPAPSPLGGDEVTSLYALVQTVDGTSFYPPLGPQPVATGAFDPNLLARLRVLLEATDAAGRTSTVGTFDAATSPALRLYPQWSVYFVDVPAAAYFTNPALAYRFRVLLDGAELGRSDLSGVVFDVLAHVPNLTVGVKLRIEDRAAPTLAQLSPATITRDAGGFTLTVTGANFASDSVVRFGETDLATTRVSGTTLTAAVPAALTAALGTYAITVHTPAPGGGTSASASFVVYDPTPVLGSVAPSSATEGDAGLTLTVDGAHFTEASTVRFDATVLATTFVSPAELTAFLPASALATAGVHTVLVENAGGLRSSGASFTVAHRRAEITALSPATVRAGTPSFTLTIGGASFVDGAEVSFDGTALATTFVSATELRALVPAALVATMHGASVVVANPAPSAGASAPAAFTVADSLPVPRGSLALYMDAAGGPAGPDFAAPGCTPSTWRDLSPNAFTGTLVGWGTGSCAADPAWQGDGTPADPYRVRFDGTNDYVRVPTAPALEATTGLTVEAWIKADSVSAQPVFISKMGSGSGGAYSGFYLQLYRGTFILSVTGNSWQLAEKPLRDATWYQLVATYDGTTKNYYVDGKLVRSVRDASGLSSTTADLLLGGYNYGGYYFGGSMPIVGIWSRVLGADEIRSNCLAHVSRFPGVSCDNPIPYLASVTPASATTQSGSATITIDGDDFMSGAVASLDGTALTTTFVSATRITAVVPAALLATARTAALTVTNPAPTQGASAVTSFPVNNPAPVLTALSPADAPVGSGDVLVTLSGASFVSGAVATLAGAPLATSFVSSSALVAVVPASALATAGSYSIVVTNPAPAVAASAARTFAVNNPAPVLASFAPAAAQAGSVALQLTVLGSSFVSGASVSLGGATLATTFVSASELRATIPASALTTAGLYDLRVANPAPAAAASATRTFTVNNAVPTLATLTPATATAGGATFTLTIDGTGFGAGATVTFGGTSYAATVASATRLTASIPAAAIAAAGAVDVYVTNPAPGGGASGTAAFTVLNATPTLTSLAPASTNVGGASFTLTVNGASFVSGASISYGATPLATTFVSATRLTATVPAGSIAAAGNVDVTVTNPAPTAGASGALVFAVNNVVPSLTTMTPGSATAGAAAFTLTIDGTSFASGAVASFAGTALTTTFVSASRLTAAVPASAVATAGTYNVTVSNPAPTTGASSALSFSVSNPVPTLTAVTPATASAGSGATVVTLTGTGFVQGSSATFNGTAIATTYVSSTQLVVTIPTTSLLSAGQYPMTVVNGTPGGGTSASVNFTVTGVQSGGLVLYLDSQNAFTTAGCTPTTWSDQSANHFTGTLTNWAGTECTTTGGWRGNNTTSSPNRLVFDGSNDYVNVPHNTALNFNNAMTIELWINPSAISGMVLNKFNGSSGYYVELYANSFILSVTGNNWRACSRTLSPNTWYQLDVTYDGSNMNFYVNGAFVNSASNTAGVTGVTNDLWIGQYFITTYAHFNGSLAILGEWGRVLSASEIRANCLANAYRFPGITCP